MNVLIGASGLLGTHMEFDYYIDRPSSSKLDITSWSSIKSYFEGIYSTRPKFSDEDTIILSAAYTNSGNSNNQKELAYDINVNGVRNICRILSQIQNSPRLVYISSDYVFRGDKGNYKTSDVTDPVPNNYYAYTKAVAEEIVRTYKNHLIIRTSFCPTTWPYDNALCDKFTSADKVTIIAPMIVEAISKIDSGVIHVGTERKSTYDLAKTIKPDVKPSARSMFPNYSIAYDTSMKISKW